MKKNIKWIGIVLVAFIFIGILSSGEDGGSENPQEQTASQTETTQQKENIDYEILSQKDEGTVENIAVLIDAGETQGEEIANEINETCSKQCNISLYNDREAYELQTEYDALMSSSDTTPDELQEWKQENYVFVADHHIGYMDFGTETYQAYPYRDWYYEELTSK